MSVYLPAIADVKKSLNATSDEVSATIFSYLFAVAVGLLVWGPLSDYYGRLKVLLIGLLVFLLATIGCIFAPDINSLIVMRIIEGFFVGLTEVIK